MIPAAPGTPSARRAIFIDAARHAAILGALTIHALLVFGVWEQVPPVAAKGLANGVFRACTPTFYILFGVMLEWVHSRRARRDGPQAATRPLLKRAWQCWIGLLVGILCAALSGNLPWTDAMLSALNIEDAPLVSVLRFYSLAMLLCIPVVLARVRFGRAVPWLLAAAIWAISPALALLPWPAVESPWAFLCGFLFGHPPVWLGGSVWHNLSLVFLGMGLGAAMRDRLEAGLDPLGGRTFIGLILLCAAGIALSAWVLGLRELAHGYFGGGMLLRTQHHPAYFAIGTLSALGGLWVAQLLLPTRTDPAAVPWWLVVLGRNPLLAFVAGNAALNLIPRRDSWPLALGVPLTLVYLAVLLVGVRIAERRCTGPVP